MKKIVIALAFIFGLAAASYAQEAKVYPGATLDKESMKEIEEMRAKATEEVKLIMGETKIYITTASFAKVYAFYKKKYTETDLNMKKTDQKLPDGKLLNDAYFCLDTSTSISESRHWMKIQNPFIGQVKVSKEAKGKLEGVKEVTVISIVKKF